jgi:hypothetical protein
MTTNEEVRVEVTTTDRLNRPESPVQWERYVSLFSLMLVDALASDWGTSPVRDDTTANDRM